MTQEKSYQLTSYPIGSIREIWTIAWPLMLGLLSNSIMFFMDRLLLSRFSISSMNASATAGTCSYAFMIFPMIIAGICEVFVGQYHGGKNASKMGAAVWQMLWFSLLIAPIFLLIAFFAPEYLFRQTEHKVLETIYFSTVISFASFYCFSTALIGFFAGQGKVRLIAIGTLLGNGLNIVLDILLIFGRGKIPSMGIKGAAVATVISQIFMVIFFLCFFLSKNARKIQGANKWKFNKEIFVSCLKIGLPASIAHTSEFFSHFIFFIIMSLAGTQYLTIAVLIQTVYILIFFVVEGLSKGVTAICSNLIGGKQYSSIWKNLKSTFLLHTIFFLVVFFIFIFFSPKVFHPFFTEENSAFLQDPSFITKLYRTSILLGFFWLFDGWAWSLIGMLTAAGDTKFIMKIGIIAPWLLYLFPTWVGIKYFHITIDQVWFWIVAYGLIAFFIYLWRYKTNKWKQIKLCNKISEKNKNLQKL